MVNIDEVVARMRAEKVIRLYGMEQLSKLRSTAEVSQEKIAKLCGCSGVSVGKWESGENNPTPQNALAYITALEIEIPGFSNIVSAVSFTWEDALQLQKEMA